MNRLRSTTASRDDAPDSSEKVLFHGSERVPEDANVDTSPPETWFLIVTGCLVAAMISSLSGQLPRSHTLSWTAIFLLSIKLIALAAIAGAIGISIPWLFLKPKPPFSLAFLSKHVAVAWIFFPCIALLYRQQSPSMFPVLALATVALALNLRWLGSADAETDKKELPAWYTSDLSSLYGLPIAGFRPLSALLVATCLQAALILAAVERPFFASILLSACLFLLAWRWNVSDGKATTWLRGNRKYIVLSASAIFFTVLALAPWVGGKPVISAQNKAHKPALITHDSADSDVPGSEFVGIILWPPPIKKTEIVPPRPESDSGAIGRRAKPVVIPFDGQYWYFKAPSTRPGPRAHIAHGRATYVNVHSTNASPLLMEAYQNLGTSIDLECCSEIDVAITNADVRPGTIALSVRLTDSNSIGRPSIDLAPQIITSSTANSISMSRPPVEEVLRFPIPRFTAIHRFSEITMVYMPAKERARAGAQVSIQTFTLIPK